MIERLLSSSPGRRRHTLEALPPSVEGAWVARDLLLFDDDAHVRAAAATYIGLCRSRLLSPALRDALYDDRPSVRHAAIVGLARLKEMAFIPLLSTLALADPIWWVRRRAIRAVAALSPEPPLALLSAALDDPFWRVRHAAVRALRSAAATIDSAELSEKLGTPGSDRAKGALTYLKRRLGLVARTGDSTDTTAPATGRIADADPAVVTARLQAGEAASTAFLVECLGDSHEALRRIAVKRLRGSGDLRALTMAMLWLEEPRIPHSASTVLGLLDGLESDVQRRAVENALAGDAPGALVWALSLSAEHRDGTRLPVTLRLATHVDARVRRAAIAAIRALSNRDASKATVEVLQRAWRDPDEVVARLAAEALLATRDPELLSGLAEQTPSADVLLRRVQVQAAADLGAVARLREALDDGDPAVRAQAVSGLRTRGALSDTDTAQLVSDPDPWIRTALLDAADLARVARDDPHPSLRRSAFTRMSDRVEATRIAGSSPDPWLRARASAGLVAHETDDLKHLLRLSRDGHRAVRAAAWETIERALERDEPALDGAVERVLQDERDPETRIAALTVRLRRFDPDALAELRARGPGESEVVRRWIADCLAGFDGAAREAPVTRAHSRPASRPGRALGRTGLELSALSFSGVGLVPDASLRRALDGGCNTFFWEPRHQTLTRFLRRGPGRTAQVITGSFHASEDAITADVERALRRLRRETIDIFLLFWARSPARLEPAMGAVLARLKTSGRVRAVGFSTHDRELACGAIRSGLFDVAMVRHSAAHPGAEESVFPLAQERGVGVLAFSSLCYGRLLGEGITAADAYRYSLLQPAVTTVISAPRNDAELRENLAVLEAPAVDRARLDLLRERGRGVREDSRDFSQNLRRFPAVPDEAADEWDEELEEAEALSSR